MLFLNMTRAIHDVKATDMGLSKVRFKAEVDFDGRVVTRSYLEKQDIDQILNVRCVSLLVCFSVDSLYFCFLYVQTGCKYQEHLHVVIFYICYGHNYYCIKIKGWNLMLCLKRNLCFAWLNFRFHFLFSSETNIHLFCLPF